MAEEPKSKRMMRVYKPRGPYAARCKKQNHDHVDDRDANVILGYSELTGERALYDAPKEICQSGAELHSQGAESKNSTAKVQEVTRTLVEVSSTVNTSSGSTSTGNEFEEDLPADSEEPITLVEPPLSAFSSYFEPINNTEEPLVSEMWEEELDHMNRAGDLETECDGDSESETGSIVDDPESTENVESEHETCEGPCDPPLYSGAPKNLTCGLAMLLIVSFAIRHELTGEALSNLLIMMNMLLPVGNQLSRTLGNFRSYFSKLEVPIVYHAYCSFCYAYIPNDNKTTCCPNKACLKFTSRKGGKGYFIEVPIATQIAKFFKREGFIESLQHRFKRVKKDPLAIEDIYDGSIYKALFEKGILSNPNNISLLFNTDGAPVFKSSKLQMWPIYMTINELSPSKRILKENLILAGLWYSDNKPPMWTFLKPTILSMKELEEKGVQVEIGNKRFTCHVFLIAGSFDLPARCLVCNSKQFNGQNGCWKCLQKGQTVKTKKGGRVHAFPFEDYNKEGVPRTKEMVQEDALRACREDKIVNGVKGPSWLLALKHFDCVRGVAIDYMHGILLGVTKTLLTLLFSTQHKSQPFSVCGKVEMLDNRLADLKPPFEIKRKPRPVSTHLKYWKATELRNFLLFYAAPCLYGLVQENYLEHFILLSHSTYLLSKESIMPSDLENAKMALLKFCKDFSGLYSERYETLNVHQLLHLVDNVEDLGPLFTHSLFSFEDKNKFVLSLIHGTRNIQSQITYAVSLVQNLPILEQKTIKPNTIEADFYRKLTKSSVVVKKTEIEPTIWVLGGTKSEPLTEEECRAMTVYLDCVPVTKNVLKFQRVMIAGQVYHSKLYSKASQSSTYTAMYRKPNGDLKFGHINGFFQYSHHDEMHNMATISCLEVVAKVAHITKVRETGILVVSAVNQIKDLCVYLHVAGEKQTGNGDHGNAYVLRFPNRIEKD